MTELAYSVASDLVVKLGFLAYEKISAAWGVRDDLKKIETTMLLIKQLLLDAEEKQSQNRLMKIWLEKLKDVCYDAEDVVDEFVVEDLRRHVASGNYKRQVRRFLSSSNPAAFHFRMARKIKIIRERLDEIGKEKQSFGLTKRDQTNRPVHRGMTHSHIDPDDVFGRDDEKEDIVKFLLNGAARSNNPSVIAIVGMGGLGKTTLAKLICNDDEVEQHFDLIMWACVSDDFELKTVVEKIIKATKNTNSKFEGSYSEMEMEVLQTMLREKINGRRYLLFLDDVWNEDKTKWDELETLLRVGAEGSAVMVTTRSNKVASIMGTVKPYILEGLPHDVCMSIFIKYAFNKGDEKQYPAQVKIGDEIVKKCGGVPLAVRTLASLLYPGTDAQKWKEIRDSQIWKLEEKDKYILPALKLSYEQLPFHLKRCFAYCSIFPKDFFFYGHYLAQFWMAHGLLGCANENVKLEDVGLSNIRELEKRCFFQDFEDLGFSISFKMHDLVHDLALSVAGDECLTISSATHLISRRVRHLSFAELDSLPPNIPSLLQGLDPIVRTISIRLAKESPILNSILETSFSRFKYMRALNFQRCQIEVLPSTIGDLKHLRYLNLDSNKLIKRLPDSVFKLQNLETLLLLECTELEELPEDVRLLVNLRFLWITTKQKIFPKNSISSLTYLQELCFFECNNLEFWCDDIQGLINLRSLRILSCRSLVSLPKGMHNLTALQLLTICNCANLIWSSAKPDDGIKNVSSLHLKELFITQLPKLVTLPDWLFQESVEKITIANCPSLNELPDSFKKSTSLQFLWLVNSPGITELPGLNNMTSLGELHIRFCPKLEERFAPYTGQDRLNIAHIPKVYIG